MKNVFIYDYSRQEKGKPKRTSVIFSTDIEFETGTIRDELKMFSDDAMPPDEVYLIVGKSVAKEKIHEIHENQILQSAVKAWIKDKESDGLKVLQFDEDGVLWQSQLDSDDTTIAESISKTIKLAGLREIFKKRGGILESASTHHYVKPSNKHCDAFIRTANVLHTSSEINFIAFCLLQYIKEDTKNIYCDTSSIYPVAYAACLLKKNLLNSVIDISIESFGSYDGLDGFQFEFPALSLLLISASTSGDLVKKIMTDKSIDESKIVTLFYLSEEPVRGKTICNLKEDQPFSKGLKTINSSSPDKCPWCRKGSVCIKIMGDQFLLENPKATEHLITKENAPKELSNFIKQIKGEEIIKCYYDEFDIPNRVNNKYKREIFFNLKRAYETVDVLDSSLTDFYKRLKRVLEQNLPNSLNRIIHLDDTASETLALVVKDRFLSRNPTAKLDIKPAREIIKYNKENVSDSGVTIVVCGCMCTGRKLMGVSQSLRRLQRNGAIIFLVGMSRTPDEKTFKEIKSNLTYGDEPGDYGFYCIRSIFCRDSQSGQLTTWDREASELTNLLSETESIDNKKKKSEVRAFIEKRLKCINEESLEGGLFNNVFLPSSSVKHKQLMLRPNMVFLDFPYKDNDISQSEVYFIISSILHNLRAETQRSPALIQHEHHRVVIAPTCFYRFNDGVIQAALLRAADVAELDYSVNTKYSERMRDVLSQIFQNWDNESGEATLEFLLALKMKTLKLRKEDTLMSVEIFSKMKLTPIIEFLCEKIRVDLTKT